MSDYAYLIVYKEDRLRIRGINSGAEMATLFLARFLARAGKRVIVAAHLEESEQVHEGVEYWDLGEDYNVGRALGRARDVGGYHLISAGRALAILESRREESCKSRILVSHDRSGDDSGLKAKILCKTLDRIICVSNAQKEVFL